MRRQVGLVVAMMGLLAGCGQNLSAVHEEAASGRSQFTGLPAPDFTLKDQNGKTVKLSGLAGKRVLLSFRPMAWTAVCHDQMKSLEDNHAKLDSLNAVALGIGVDSVPSNKAWAESMAVKNTSLLSDFWPHGEVAKS